MKVAITNLGHHSFVQISISFKGTIKCDFQNDWCDFAVSNTGDSHSVHGLGWTRETGDTIKNKQFQGPERGKYEQ